jgi:hypothetical protein
LVSAGVFAHAPRFHQGLFAGEVPAILQRGETVIPRGASVAAPPPNVNVHLHNESGQPLDAKQQNVEWNGREYVVNMVLLDYHQGGRIRGIMKGGA